MSLPYIGTPPTGHELTDIGANIRNMLNPNWQMQLEMQRKMMTDPQLVSQLAEVERNAPGTIAKLGFGKKLTGIIQNTPETLEQKSKKEILGLQLQDAKNNLEQFSMQKTKFEEEQADREKLLKGIEGFKGFDFTKEADNFMAGKPNPKFMEALAKAGNENQQVFHNYVQNLSQIRTMKFQEEQADKRLRFSEANAYKRIEYQDRLESARQDDAYKKMLNSNAIDSYQKTGVGSPSAWKNILDFGSGGAERMQTLMQNPALAKNDMDRQLLAIGIHTQQSQDAAKQLQVSSMLVKARQSMSAAQNPNLKRDEIAPYVNDINSIYQGIRQIDPTFNRSVRQNGKDIQLIDENTGAPITNDNDAFDVTKLQLPPNTTPRQLFDRAASEYESLPHGFSFASGMNKAKYLKKFKATYGDEAYNALNKRLK